MNYKKHYELLISRARNRNIDGYIENHHVIPKCMGGDDNEYNIVALTPEEHYLAHQLLVKIYPENVSLKRALSAMFRITKKHNGNRSSFRKYGWIKREIRTGKSGENNPSALFTTSEVIDIYYSTDSLDALSKKYNCNRYNITSIKRKIYYRNITENITDLPGFNFDNKTVRLPIPIDFIEKIFYDTGSYEYFWEKYRATKGVVRGIKTKRSFKHITQKLGIPGQVSRYGLTRDKIMEIYNAKGTNKDIAERFGIHYNTVRNIKGKYSRVFSMWEEF